MTSTHALQVSVEDVSGSDATPKAGCFSRWLRRAFEGELSGELSIRIVGEDEGRALNSRYRDRPYATNVLSFAGADLPADTDGEIPRHLGDLVLCAPVVEREALEQKKAADAHWAHLTIHGVLHLLGFDHEADAEARVMEQREAELLLRLGFDDPYEDER